MIEVHMTHSTYHISCKQDADRELRGKRFPSGWYLLVRENIGVDRGLVAYVLDIMECGTMLRCSACDGTGWL